MLAFSELIHKFFYTFYFDRAVMITLHTPDTVSFRLIGQRLRMSMHEFSVALVCECPNSIWDFLTGLMPTLLTQTYVTTR